MPDLFRPLPDDATREERWERFSQIMQAAAKQREPIELPDDPNGFWEIGRVDDGTD